MRRRHHDLEPVLAGVAGARDEQLAPGTRHGRRAERIQHARCRLAARHGAPHLLARHRALHGNHREVGARRDRQAGGPLRRECGDPGDVLVGRRRVDHETEEILAQEIDDQVVEHTAIVAQQARIERLARNRQLVDVVGERVTQEQTWPVCAVAVEVDDAHVRHVEHARIAANRVMLVDLRAVVDRHVPPAEVDHPSTGRAVQVVQRGGFQHADLRLEKRRAARLSASPRLSFYLRDCGRASRCRCPFGGLRLPGAAALQIVPCCEQSFCLSGFGITPSAASSCDALSCTRQQPSTTGHHPRCPPRARYPLISSVRERTRPSS